MITGEKQFHADNFHPICNELASIDKELSTIIETYGYPTMWTRPPGFSTLVYIILEQQVSLASAKAAFTKLQDRLTPLTPDNLLLLTDEEMRACYFSRQKMQYVRHLANAIVSKQLKIDELSSLPDQQVRKELRQIKGIGDWTADIYLMFALQRTDVFPVGDLAMINAFKEIKKANGISREEIIEISQAWSPHRSIATMMLWHYYINRKGIKI